MEALEILKTTEVLIGLILSIFGSGVGVIVWFQRQIRKAASETVSSLGSSQERQSTRLTDLEKDVNAVGIDLAKLNKRVAHVELSMQLVAKQSELSDLQIQVGKFEGLVTGELKLLSGMMHSFRESAIRSAERKAK